MIDTSVPPVLVCNSSVMAASEGKNYFVYCKTPLTVCWPLNYERNMKLGGRKLHALY